MWSFDVCFFVLLYSILLSVFVVGTNGSENRQHENTTNPSNYTIVTSFSKSANVGNATGDSAVSNAPITVNVLPAGDNVNKDKDNFNKDNSKNENSSSENSRDANHGERSNITTKGEIVSKKDGNLSSISSGKAVEKIPANRPSLWNNTALLNAFFPSLHAATFTAKYDGKHNDSDGDRSNDVREMTNTTTHGNDNYNNNSNNNNNNGSYTLANITNTYDNATQATSLSQNNATLSNMTSNLIPRPVNETTYTRNGTKVLTNNLFDDAIPIAQNQNTTTKQKSENKTESESAGATGGNNKTTGPSFTPRKPSYYVPDIPSKNPIKDEVSNNVVNHVVNPFASSDSPASSEQSNFTKVQTTKQSSKENTSFPDFPDAPFTGNVSRPQNVSAGNATAAGVNRDNMTTPVLLYNSTTLNDAPDHLPSGNVTVGNETKPVISSVFMGIIPIPRKKTTSNIVNTTSQNFDNSTASNNSLPLSGGHKANTSLPENGSPTPLEMKNTKYLRNYSEQNNASVVGSRSNITVIGSRNNTTMVGSRDNTTVVGSKDNTTVVGSRDNTTVVGSRDNTTVVGSRNNITVVGSKNDITVVGSKDNTTVVGSRNNITVVGSRNDITTTNVNDKAENNSVTQFVTNQEGISLFSDGGTKTDPLDVGVEAGRNKTQTRSIKPSEVVELGPEEVVDGGLVTSRPVNHVTVMKAADKEAKKKKVTPESEMMDDNILHPTALMEYYELRDDGSETCEGRPEGTYAIRDVTKFLLCKGKKMKVISCDGDMVYDVNVQKCTPRNNVGRDRFCRFRGDGTWDSPWNSRMNVQCAKGFISGETCKHDLRYDPVLKDCVEDTLIIRCFSVDRDYTNAKLGCYRKNNMKMEMLINDLPGSRGKHILDWNKFADSVESLVCRCSKAAYEKGYPFFAIRLWAECWAGKNGTELDSLVSDQTQRDEKFCYSNISIAAFDKCEDNDTRVCVGSEHGQYIYKIVNVTEVNFTNSAPSKSLTEGGSSRSQINNQQSTTFIDLITLTDLQKIQASGKLRLIDVREEFEYDDVGSIRDSINIPLKDLSRALMMSNREFKAKYGIPKPAKDDCGIVFLCSSGVRSDMAYKIAKDMGYKCPKSLKGGYDLLPKVPIM